MPVDAGILLLAQCADRFLSGTHSADDLPLFVYLHPSMSELPPLPLALSCPIAIVKNILGSVVNDGHFAE